MKRELHDHIQGRGLISYVALGLTDGLVTNLAFLAGFAGGNYDVSIIRFAGIAAMLAGTVSMFFGGYLAARSERDLYRADAVREAKEIEHEPEEERNELKSFYVSKGLTQGEADLIVNRIASDKKIWLQDLLTHELHINEEKLENPYKLGMVTGLSFLAGAFVPLSIYFFPLLRTQAVITSISVSLTFLFIAGMWKGQLANRKVWKAGLEMLGIGTTASLLLYLIGTILVFV